MDVVDGSQPVSARGLVRSNGRTLLASSIALIALILCVKTLILCVNAGAIARHPRCAARRQEASGHQEFGWLRQQVGGWVGVRVRVRVRVCVVCVSTQ